MAKKLLLELYGIGEQNVEPLYEKLVNINSEIKNVKSKKQLRKLLLNSELFTILPMATRADVMFNPCKEIPHDVLAFLEMRVKKYLKTWKFDFAGSYRRKTKISHDLDLVISRRGKQDLKSLWKKFSDDLNKIPSVKTSEPFAIGDNKAVFILQFNYKNKTYRIKVDGFFVPPSEYIFMLLYATGSGRFNMLMRRQAKVRNMLLNQKGLFKLHEKSNIRIPVKNEKDVFELLGMRWRKPEDRNLH